MKIKAQDLSGRALDWAVEIAEQMTVSQQEFQPSTNWAQGGPIIERDLISTGIDMNGDWRAVRAFAGRAAVMGSAATLLTAAMRCYVASTLGDVVDVPDELLGE